MAASHEALLHPHTKRKRLHAIGVLIAFVMVVALTVHTDRAVARTNACNGLTILVVHADGAPNRLQTELLAQSNVNTVDLFNGTTGTPTAGEMSPFDLVVPLSDGNWADSTALGNALADYADQKGTVVPLNFSFYDTVAQGIQGRYRTEGYSPFTYNTALDFSNATLGAFNANHPLMNGVSALGAFYRHDVTLATGAAQVAAWTDGSPLIAHKGRVIGINFHPQEGEPASWTGDFARVIVNAGNWKSIGCPTKTTLKITKTASKVKAKGKVSPNHSGQRVTVTLQRKSSGSFSKVAGKKAVLNARSKYSTSFNRPAPGSCRIKVRFGGHKAHHPTHRASGATKTFRC